MEINNSTGGIGRTFLGPEKNLTRMDEGENGHEIEKIPLRFEHLLRSILL
jgi:hypothetical protein